MRKICYISGTRADYGLMRSTLAAIDQDAALDLSLVVTGMHLDPRYGETVSEIESDGRRIIKHVPVPFDANDGAEMATNIGTTIIGIVAALRDERPDLVLLLGDRGEMLAGALAGLHLSIPVVHIHGGERSGTVDEPVRHAISKLSHIHLTATEGARDRLIRMGEEPANIHVVGAPGLDGIASRPIPDRIAVTQARGIDPARPVALLIYHPVVQHAHSAEREIRAILDALAQTDMQVVAIEPNSDAGSRGILEELRHQAEDTADLKLYRHVPRDDFLELMAIADLMIGNSSAGIIEAASLGLPAVNVGSRQNFRERNASVTDVESDVEAMVRAIRRTLASGRSKEINIYGDGRAAERIVALLRDYSITPSLLDKVNRY